MDIPGKTIITDEVFIELARASLIKVNEVFRQEKKGALAEFTQLIAERIIPQIIVKKSETDTVDNHLGKVNFEMKLTLFYGMNIPDTVKKVREAVVNEVQNLTGYHVDRIDVIVEKLIKSEKAELVVEQS